MARDQWAPPPLDFASSIVQGKTYDATDPRCSGYFEQVLALIFGVPTRLGQRAFRAVVMASYEGRCAVTGDRIRPVLEAAHIRPVTDGGENRLDNGLLFRSDVHTRVDAGYLAVDPGYQLLVSPRLRREFGNGEEFYARAATKQPIIVPTDRADRPNKEFLEWHLDEKFLTG